MIIEKYRRELDDLINKLKQLKEIKFDSVNVYGSAYNEEMFVDKISDIDVIVMCKDFIKLNKNEIINQLYTMNIDFKEKRPIIIKDSLCERIEFYIAYENINIDVTICPGLIPSRESLERDAWYDGFEALMGGVYINSKCIYGKIPDYDEFLNNYYPFYDEQLREKRLKILSNRLKSYNERIEGYIKNNSPELIDHIFKNKKYFLKFMYINNGKYFWSPEKHTYYQLTRFLNLGEEEKRILCFMDGNFLEASKRYFEYSKDYIEKYENKITKRLIK